MLYTKFAGTGFQRMVDNGDGTFSPVVVLAADPTIDIGVVDQGAAGAAPWLTADAATLAKVEAVRALLAASLPLPTGAATQATLAAILAALPGTLDSGALRAIIEGALPAGEAHLGAVGGHISTPSATFTRPADTTAYASGDLIANNVTAGSVVPLSWVASRAAAGSFMVRRARLKKSGLVNTNASFRLHLYGASPTVTNGDNGVWSSSESGYLGSLDLDMSGTTGRVFSDAAEVVGQPAVGSEISVSLGSGSTIYGLLEARGAYTPGNAEVFTVVLEVLQN